MNLHPHMYEELIRLRELQVTEAINKNQTAHEAGLIRRRFVRQAGSSGAIGVAGTQRRILPRRAAREQCAS